MSQAAFRVGRSISAVFIGLGVLFGVLQTARAQAPSTPTLNINAANITHEISPLVYGANFGPLNALPQALLEEAQASNITLWRFPGGRWGDQNDIREQQIDMLMLQAGIVGTEVLISARLEDGTPEQAAELVRYVNIEKGYGVRYWSVGNEPNLFANYTVDDLNREWRPIVEAMLAVDPSIQIVAPDLSQYTGDAAFGPFDANGKDWLREFLLANGDLVDVVAVHRYPFPTSLDGSVASIEDLRQDAPRWDNLLTGMRAVIQETTGREIPVAVTEASSHWSKQIGGEATPDSHASAIWWADVLGRLIRDDALMVAYFNYQSSDQLGGWGLLSRFSVRPSYYVYQLYGQFGQQYIATPPVSPLSAHAALRDDGALTVMLVNLQADAQPLNIALENFAAGDVQILGLDAQHNATPVDVPATLTGIEVPPMSVWLVVIAPA